MRQFNILYGTVLNCLHIATKGNQVGWFDWSKASHLLSLLLALFSCNMFCAIGRLPFLKSICQDGPDFIDKRELLKKVCSTSVLTVEVSGFAGDSVLVHSAPQL